MTPAEATPALAPGTRFAGKYEIVRMIGRGGMAAVYEAIHVDLKKRVAIKVLLASVASQGAHRRRFLREGEVAARIRHPHVVDVTDVGTTDGNPYLVMEYLEGEDLAALLAREGALSVERTVDLLLPVVAAVAAGHRAGVIHRDLKPQNIFIARAHGEVRPKVLDFGVSKLVAEPGLELTTTAAVFGTPAYMSPEQARGAKLVDARSDQYSIGLLLYECVTGQRAHQGDNALAVLRDIGDGRLAPLRQHRPDVPAPFEAIVMKALDWFPEGRWPSLEALGAALLPFGSARAAALWTEIFCGVPGPAPAAVVVREPRSLPETAPSAPDTTLGNGGPGPAALGRRRWPIGLALIAASAVAAFWLVPAWRVSLAPAPSRSQDPTPGPEPGPHPAAPAVSQEVSRRDLAPSPGGGGSRDLAPGAGGTSGSSRDLAPGPAAARRVELRVTPGTASIALDGQVVGHGVWKGAVPRDGRRHVLVVQAPGHRSRTLELGRESVPAVILLPRLPAAPSRPRAAATSSPSPSPAPPAAPAEDVLIHRR